MHCICGVRYMLPCVADLPHVVGWWPLQEAYGGRDVSGHGNHMELHGVTFPADLANPWAIPAARFASSYGHVNNGPHLLETSFSFVAKAYATVNKTTYAPIVWQFGGTYGTRIYILDGELRARDCTDKFLGLAITINAWHTVAVTYDYPTRTLKVWVDGAHTSRTLSAQTCGTNNQTSTEFLTGRRSFR
jgi:hypothetical protein